MSKAAEDIRTAHALVRAAIGTSSEHVARVNLRVVVERVERVKREQDEQRARGAR